MITIRGSTGMWVLGVLGDKEAVVRLRVHTRLPVHVCPMFLHALSLLLFVCLRFCGYPIIHSFHIACVFVCGFVRFIA